jgi:Cdc6-like AAA superfamily ATPase
VEQTLTGAFPAGSGKTILASSVIDSLVTSSKLEGFGVSFHYCDHADKRTLEPNAILGTLARSLSEDVDLRPEIAHLINDYYRNGERVPETKDVLEILSRTIDGFKNVVLVLDGIDEVREEDRHIIYETLRKLVGKHHVPIRVFMSCRDDAALAVCSTPGSAFSIQISEKVISTDIEDYIRHSVASLLAKGDLVIRAPELQEEIVLF